MSLYISPSSTSSSPLVFALLLSLKLEIAACKRASISSIEDCRFRFIAVVEGEEEPDVSNDSDLDDRKDEDVEVDGSVNVEASKEPCKGEEGGDRIPNPRVVDDD